MEQDDGFDLFDQSGWWDIGGVVVFAVVILTFAYLAWPEYF